jgi:L-fuculose-phosphate aldolase
VFRTRSPDRPNPIGVHRVTVIALEGPASLRVAALEAFDGTPIIDLRSQCARPRRRDPTRALVRFASRGRRLAELTLAARGRVACRSPTRGRTGR